MAHANCKGIGLPVYSDGPAGKEPINEAYYLHSVTEGIGEVVEGVLVSAFGAELIAPKPGAIDRAFRLDGMEISVHFVGNAHMLWELSLRSPVEYDAALCSHSRVSSACP